VLSAVGASLASVHAPLCGAGFLRWCRGLAGRAVAASLSRLEVLTLASQHGGYPNTFTGEGTGLMRLHTYENLRLARHEVWPKHTVVAARGF
jgi:hypothetical protein